MEDKLTGTDIRMMAKGYWERYFEWRFHPKAKWLLAAAALFFGLLLVVAAATPAVVSSALYILALVLGILAFGSLTAAFYVYGSAKKEFLDSVVDVWEKGEHSLPREAAVAEFVNRRK